MLQDSCILLSGREIKIYTSPMWPALSNFPRLKMLIPHISFPYIQVRHVRVVYLVHPLWLLPFSVCSLQAHMIEYELLVPEVSALVSEQPSECSLMMQRWWTVSIKWSEITVTVKVNQRSEQLRVVGNVSLLVFVVFDDFIIFSWKQFAANSYFRTHTHTYKTKQNHNVLQ